MENGQNGLKFFCTALRRQNNHKQKYADKKHNKNKILTWLRGTHACSWVTSPWIIVHKLYYISYLSVNLVYFAQEYIPLWKILVYT